MCLRYRIVGLGLMCLDIDEKSLQFARQNIQANGLQDRIKLLQTDPEAHLFPPVIIEKIER